MYKISSDTIARTIVTGLALFNQVLAVTGHTPLDLAESDIYQIVSLGCTIVMTGVSWWKNNSFTQLAIQADKQMKLDKEVKKAAMK